MDYKQVQKKIAAAQGLFMDEISTVDKLKSVSTLLRGAHRDIDTALDRFERELATYEKIREGEIVELGVEHLPENTEKETKRKRALLLLVTSWKSLKSEVARVHAVLTEEHARDIGTDKVSMWGRIFQFAKGPLGITTVIAIVIVGVMQITSVQLTILNKGCGTFVAVGVVPISLPGLALPKDPIVNGGSGIAVLPPLTFTIDGTVSGAITMQVLTYSIGFQLPINIKTVTLNNVLLLGVKQSIRLSEQKTHTLVLTCGS